MSTRISHLESQSRWAETLTGKGGISSREQARRLVILSSVPPMETGPADYLLAALKEVHVFLCRMRVLVVTDLSCLKEGEAAKMLGLPVIDYPQYVPEAHDIVLVFLANNHFHSFCFHFLRRPRVVAKVVSVIHDVQVFMHMNTLSLQGEYGFDDDALEEMLSAEFAHHAPLLVRQCRLGMLPELFFYTTSVQTLALRHSSAIWVHSHFAAAKLLLERAPGTPLPPIRIVHHPGGAHARPSSAAMPAPSPPRFTVGVFGWVSPIKRVSEIMRAFSRWLLTLPEADRTEPELLVVGKLPPPSYYDPAGLAETLGPRDCVAFTGYVDLPTFEALLGRCSLVFNLRFPSAGETSGTLQRARDLSIPVAVSAYAAFHEEPADYRCSVLEEQEQEDIIAVLAECWHVWKAFGSTRTLCKSRSFGAQKMSFREAFLSECHLLVSEDSCHA